MAPELKLISAKEVAKKGEPIKKVKTPEIPLVEPEEVIPAKISREPIGVRPIIPTGNTCCVGVCTYLNNEIDGIGQAVKIRQEELKFQGRGEARIRTRRQVSALVNKISSLKDMRFTFAEKGICKCIEEVKFPEKRIK